MSVSKWYDIGGKIRLFRVWYDPPPDHPMGRKLYHRFLNTNVLIENSKFPICLIYIVRLGKPKQIVMN